MRLELAYRAQIDEEFAPLHELHSQVDKTVILRETVEFHDQGMVHVRDQRNLVVHVVHLFVFYQVVFLQQLDRHEFVALFVLGQLNCAERSLSDCPRYAVVT